MFPRGFSECDLKQKCCLLWLVQHTEAKLGDARKAQLGKFQRQAWRPQPTHASAKTTGFGNIFNPGFMVCAAVEAKTSMRLRGARGRGSLSLNSDCCSDCCSDRCSQTAAQSVVHRLLLSQSVSQSVRVSQSPARESSHPTEGGTPEQIAIGTKNR